MKARVLTMMVVCILASLLSGCASTGLALLNSKVKLSTNHSVISDVRYGEQAWQKLDIHNGDQQNSVTAKPDQTKPVLVFFYGGSWDSGKKEQYFFAATSFVKLGYVVVIPDYIKFPKGKFPAFVEDGAASLAWVKNNIADYGGDPDKLFVVGHSAGAHLGALLSADKSYLQKEGMSPLDITGFAGLAGPYNFTPRARKIVRVFEPASNYPKMKIANHIDGDEPPMFLLHGLNDTTVGLQNKDITYDEIKQVGGEVAGLNYPGLSHVGILLALDPLFDRKAQPASDIDNYFRTLLRTDVSI